MAKKDISPFFIFWLFFAFAVPLFCFARLMEPGSPYLKLRQTYSPTLEGIFSGFCWKIFNSARQPWVSPENLVPLAIPDVRERRGARTLMWILLGIEYGFAYEAARTSFLPQIGGMAPRQINLPDFKYLAIAKKSAWMDVASPAGCSRFFWHSWNPTG